MPLQIKIDDFEKAVSEFNKALDYMAKVEARQPETLTFDEEDYQFDYNFARAAVIQYFEFTYEITWKLMKRWLDINVTPGVADGIVRRELFRMARENRLIEDVKTWWSFHEARNKTSHTYDSDIAEEVYKTAKVFKKYVNDFLSTIRERL